MPRPQLHGNGHPTNVRAATEAHVALLSEAQTEIAETAPTPAFETYHDLLRTAVDYERLAAQLLLVACDAGTSKPAPDRDVLSDSIAVWRKYCSPEATAEAEAKRAREFEKAQRRVARNGS
jgi:hypothetical protein